jgi:RNA polymerase sigma factor (sigma-70 family)
MMDESDRLTERFEAHRPHLRAVAYRMLGGLSEADDAVQEAWLRLHQADTSTVENLGGWLTTVVARICLDMLRTRAARHEEPLGPRCPDPIVTHPSVQDPEQEVLLAEAVGYALLVVLDTLVPAERLAFVLHDIFAVPFDDIAELIGRTPAAARQLASRARRRVQLEAPAPDVDQRRQHAVVDAFRAAARNGNFDALLALLDPDVVLRVAGPLLRGRVAQQMRGAPVVARQALGFARLAQHARAVLVNGAAGLLVAPQGQPLAVLAFTIKDERIVAIDILADPRHLRRIGLPGALA